MRIRPRTTIPQVAGTLPLVAFISVGTVVNIGDVEVWLQRVAIPVIVLVVVTILIGTRFARVVAGVALVCWWFALALSLVTVEDGSVSWFGFTTFAAIPILVAFTWGQAWGVHDIEERQSP